VDIRIHAQYNPEAISQYNIVPGLMGVILTLTLVIITGLAITRETERGTMESLLSTPVNPLEVMLGKILPYILVGYVQILADLCGGAVPFCDSHARQSSAGPGAIADFYRRQPDRGNHLFVPGQKPVAGHAAFGLLLSALILLSGFMFPFRGMPVWAQYIGEVLPLTHYLRFVRGVLLKGNGLTDSMQFIWPIIIFWVVMVAIGFKFYKRTLD
jgi:ABC-2 type transport system permease protein